MTFRVVRWSRRAPNSSSNRETLRLTLDFGMPIVITVSQEDQVQGPLADIFQRVAPAAYKARVKRAGIVNCWDDPNFRKAVVDTGRRQLVMGGITTDICLV